MTYSRFMHNSHIQKYNKNKRGIAIQAILQGVRDKFPAKAGGA
jgi:hypothetical protein